MIRDMMACLDVGVSRSDHFRSVASLAKAHDAVLLGVCAVGVPVQGYAEAAVAVEVAERETQRRRAEAALLESAFAAAATWANLRSEWRMADGDFVAVAREHGRVADLVVLEQPDPDERDPASVEELALVLGRPVLMLPYVGAPKPIGRRIMLAWNGSRESARAAHDALPFLTKADRVLVTGVNPDGAAQASAERLLAHLARHRVNAELRRLDSGGLGVGDVLLNAASDEGVDLLVMGAYGHSRMRELILGGATRSMFRHMTVPVLLSH
jgi:nucleotide-binding universal stress UspA family protein